MLPAGTASNRCHACTVYGPPRRSGLDLTPSPDTLLPPVELALSLRAGLTALRAADEYVDRRALAKAMRDNWDRRIEGAKFGGVQSIAQAKM